MTMNRICAVMASVFLIVPLAAVSQTTITSSGSLTGDDPDGTFSAFGDAFAAAADAWEDWLFVGTPRETTFRDGFDQQDGAVYIYRKDPGGGYAFSQKLTMPGSSGLAFGGSPVGDRFGGGIAAAGGWLFVSATNDQDFPGLTDPREDPDNIGDPPFLFAGQVHVYEQHGNTWEFVQTLISPEPGSFGAFGNRTQANHVTLDSKGKTAVIGELNNFDGGIGRLHTYRVKGGSWEYVQTIDPVTGIDSFGDNVVFASDKYLVAGGSDFSDDETTVQGHIFVYQSQGSSGKFFAAPKQTIAGPVVAFADCGFLGFGEDGLDAAGGVVAVADPCATGTAGAFAGAVSVYRLGGGTVPLTLEQTIEGDEPDLFFGGNVFEARHTLAVSPSGERILIGSPVSPLGFFDEGAVGADVRVYANDGSGWAYESNLTTSTPASAIFRSFGDAVFFADDETAFVREGNFIDPFVTGLKGQGLFYDLTP